MSRPQVLCVEDDELLRLVTTVALEDAGFEVEEACDGAAAMDLLSRQAYTHVVSDISMPSGVSGVAVATAWPSSFRVIRRTSTADCPLASAFFTSPTG